MPGMSKLTVHTGVRVVPAWQLHITDIVLPAQGDGPGRRVTGIRAQGAPPQVCVEFAGEDHRVPFPAGQPVTIAARRIR